jgi:anti-sigma regulatory factor (Ser/Thr protein kinase)
MTALTAVRYSAKFPGRPEQVRKVRRAVAGCLSGCPRSDDAVLIASELAANAVRHSASAGRVFTVRVEVLPGGARVEVEDLGGEWRPEPAWWEAAKAGRCSHGGHGWDGETCSDADDRPHGLDIVTALAAEWGTEATTEGGRVVWARVVFGG